VIFGCLLNIWRNTKAGWRIIDDFKFLTIILLYFQLISRQFNLGLSVSKAQVQRVTESDLEFLMWFFILIHVYFVSIKVQIVFNSNKFIN
jgi:hypothetical protein